MSNINSYVVKVGDIVEITTDRFRKELIGTKYKVLICDPFSEVFHTQNGFCFCKDGKNYKVIKKRKTG